MSKPSVWVVVLISMFASITIGSISNADTKTTVNEKCAKVEIIFARGSGQKVSIDNTNTATEANKFFSLVENKINIKTSISVHKYELGKESYGGYRYPAVAVGSRSWETIKRSLGAATSDGMAFSYGWSVKQGVGELLSYIAERYYKCKDTTNPYFILGGYSQGAQVVGQAIPSLPKPMRDRITSVGLFGDPKLYYPEGKHATIISRSEACRGKGLSLYRRGPMNHGIPGCNLENGSLGGRVPYLPEDMTDKVGMWCNDKDFVCGSSYNPFTTSGHGKYKDSGMGIEQFSREASVRLVNRLASDNMGNMMLEATRAYYNNLAQQVHEDEDSHAHQPIDTSYLFGNEGSAYKDVIYVIDVSWMKGQKLTEFKDVIRQSIPAFLASNGRFVISTFGNEGVDNNPRSIYPDRIDSVFGMGPWFLDNIDFLDNITANLPGDPLVPLYYGALSDAIDWRSGVSKSIVLITSGDEYQIPDMYGVTNEKIARRALEIDPVNIYPVVPTSASNQYLDLANLTSGRVEMYSGDDLGSALESAMQDITDKPEVYLPNSDYIAEPGEEINFDASSSYSATGKIIKYEWDFDGDNVFDATTASPIVSHIYSDTGDWIMQVRVTTEGGSVSNASTNVHVGTYESPQLPTAPTNFVSKVIKTNGDKETVLLTWDAVGDAISDKLVLSINGSVVGFISKDRTAIEIDNINTDADVEFSLAGVLADGEFGPAAFATIYDQHPLNIAGIIAQAKLAAMHEDSIQPSFSSNAQLVVTSKKQHISTEDSGVLGVTTNRDVMTTRRQNKQDYRYAWLVLVVVLIAISGMIVRNRRRHIRNVTSD